jgi:predicted transglutaminase-like cysteine proteinase
MARATAILLALVAMSIPASADAVLAPFGWSIFADNHPSEAKADGRPSLEWTAQQYAELARVNARVNRGIRPDPGKQEITAWSIWPPAGNCTDYAVTKRSELLARGWPASNLLLAEVVIPTGEHHLVLLVHGNSGNLVLDNLTPAILPQRYRSFAVVRMQSASDPNLWLDGSPETAARADPAEAIGLLIPVRPELRSGGDARQTGWLRSF